MTYQEFIRDAQKRQRAYITSETKRMNKARAAMLKYIATMGALGLHPLAPGEIDDRFRELESMSANVPVTHGDSPYMRAAFEMREGESVA